MEFDFEKSYELRTRSKLIIESALNNIHFSGLVPQLVGGVLLVCITLTGNFAVKRVGLAFGVGINEVKSLLASSPDAYRII